MRIATVKYPVYQYGELDFPAKRKAILGILNIFIEKSADADLYLDKDYLVAEVTQKVRDGEFHATGALFVEAEVQVEQEEQVDTIKLKELLRQLEELESTVSDLTDELDSTKDDIRDIEYNLNTASEDVDDYESKVSDVSDEIEELKEKINEVLKKENSDD